MLLCLSAPMETDQPKKKQPGRKAAAQKPTSGYTEISDDDDQRIQDISDEDFEVQSPPKAAGRGRGRKTNNAAAPKPPPAGGRKRGTAAAKPPASNQRLLTEMLKPAEGLGKSPDKKVRKMRASPFNKKSGSMLNRKSINVNKDEDEEEEESLDVPGSGNSTQTESGEVAAAAPARPRRATKMQTNKYVLSDSESEEDEEDAATEDSDFGEDDE